MMDIEKIAYDLIRKKAKDYMQDVSNEDLGLYVRGVVDMQGEIVRELVKNGLRKPSAGREVEE
jgi:predicted translin family RNA/ssDNA-binding protein